MPGRRYARKPATVEGSKRMPGGDLDRDERSLLFLRTKAQNMEQKSSVVQRDFDYGQKRGGAGLYFVSFETMPSREDMTKMMG